MADEAPTLTKWRRFGARGRFKPIAAVGRRMCPRAARLREKTESSGGSG